MKNQELQNFVTEQVRAFLAAPSCCAELKEVGQAWLDAVGTEGEAAATQALIQELEEDVSPIDDTIAFFASDAAAGFFGAETARKMLAHAQDVKARGGAFCDCAACTAGKAILDRKAELL